MAASPKIAYLTAGGAGMYCGSCMRDNTLAAALIDDGCDVLLVPTYTPIRTDETSVAIDRVFMGGINVYLQQKMPFLRYLPAGIDRWLSRPKLLSRVNSGNIETSAAQLGALTVSMLRGDAGRQRKEVRYLVNWLAQDVRPDLINLSNMLIAGCLPRIKRELNVPVLVTLQGDDIFLESLQQPYKDRAIALMRDLVPHVDGFLVFSQYYAELMSEMLVIPQEKLYQVPMGINVDGFPKTPVDAGGRPPTVGYLARICPEKGLDNLVVAFLQLKEAAETRDARLHIAGWLGGSERPFFEQQMRRLEKYADDVHYAGEVDRHGKIDFLRSIDVLSVPGSYREPKGIYVLEALAAGIPVVQPDHGAMPELLAATGGGTLVPSGDAGKLAEELSRLLRDEQARRALAEAGQRTVHERFHARAMAQATLEVYLQALQRKRPGSP